MKKLALGLLLLPLAALPALAHAGHPHGSHGGEVVKVKGYAIEFVEKTKGETGNLDVYVEKAGKAIAPTSVAVEVTATDGHKATAKMAKTRDHFSGPVSLEDPGAYKARVQAKVGGHTLVGRFDFTR